MRRHPHLHSQVKYNGSLTVNTHKILWWNISNIILGKFTICFFNESPINKRLNCQLSDSPIVSLSHAHISTRILRQSFPLPLLLYVFPLQLSVVDRVFVSFAYIEERTHRVFILTKHFVINAIFNCLQIQEIKVQLN